MSQNPQATWWLAYDTTVSMFELNGTGASPADAMRNLFVSHNRRLYRRTPW